MYFLTHYPLRSASEICEKKEDKKKKLISLQYLETNGCVDPISLVILANI